MGWSFPHISLEDLMKIIKAFIDMLILASGYQSTGRHAHWDSENIKKAFQWAVFLQNVSKDLARLNNYEDSIKEVDAALSELTSSQHFPQGLARLSSTTLCRATDLILKHLIDTLPSRESNLRTTITAAVEMDLDELRRPDNDCVHVYLERLMQAASINPNISRPNFSLDYLELSSSEATPSEKQEIWMDGCFSRCAIQELEKRQHLVSCIYVIEKGLGVLSNAIGESLCSEPVNVNVSYGGQIRQQPYLITEEEPIESVIWNNWRSRNVSYMLDKRTMRLVSGASLNFSVPKGQWVQILERLNVSAETDAGLSETIISAKPSGAVKSLSVAISTFRWSRRCILVAGELLIMQSIPQRRGVALLGLLELLLFGCIADRWSYLIDHVMSSSYEPLTISKIYHNVNEILLGRPLEVCSSAGVMNSKVEKCVLDYLEMFLSSQLNLLWKLPPILAALAFPCWSQLFKSYLSKLESQYRGDSSANSYCSCISNGKEHRECEVAERTWCLYIIHVGRHHKAHNTV